MQTKRTRVSCKIMAPMFIAGIDKESPELRVPGIKGAMRFIWRAAQCAGDIKDMRQREGQLFGNAFGGDNTQKSELRMQIRDANTKSIKQPMLPHRNSRDYSGSKRGQLLKTSALESGGTFDVLIQSGEDNHKMFVSLFILTTVLYGFGRRARKGMGTVQITNIGGECENVEYSPDLLNILSLLNVIAGESIFGLEDDHIEKVGGPAGEYPYIERIYLWKPSRKASTENLNERIGLAAHKFPNEHFIGSAMPRFASSLLLSTTPEPACIVTQLHCIKDCTKREDFLNELKSGVEAL